ncbi:alcohol dehydrogenase catalytic domain-containing protein [Amycolatopsis sp. WAC 04182]|uniref:alcohol dehydrogenase catalytic domain-containing protein n=1 Tax=Amycolatopsis sp. WAC 04182 TaxID=2203198 RepID=UPI001F3DCA47|nr:alcohol dehydrogenase catalytic domain-containing protein [Amycolatopsis sp. WAC 04182]
MASELMRALVFIDTDQVGIREKPIPEPGPGEVVVRTTASSICTSDIHTISGAMAIPLDRTLGHESVGVVHRTGSEVTGIREGQRVAVGGVTGCGWCEYCQRGFVAQCGGMVGGYKWTTQREGNLSEYFVAPDANFNVVPIPDDITDEQALYATDVLATGVSAAELARIPYGGTVAIFAQGSIGLCATIGARLLGAGLIITTATRPERAALSRRFGADVVLDPRRGEPVEQIRAAVGSHGVDSAIEALGTPETFEAAIRVTKPGGTIVNTGYQGWANQEPLPVPIISFGMGMGDKTIRGMMAPINGDRLTRLFRLMQTGRVDPTPLTTHRFGFDDVEHAFELMRTKAGNIIKPYISYEEGR